MDTNEYADLLIRRFQAPPPGRILEESEKLTTKYLGRLMVMQKYLQEYSEDGDFKRIQLLVMTRIIDAFVAASHLLRARYYNTTLAEVRAIYDSLNLMRWLALSEPAFRVYLSHDPVRIMKEFTASRLRQCLGRTPHDVVYAFLVSYGTHPFYTGKEYLLSVNLGQPGNLGDPQHRHYPALDAVAACILLLTYTHATYDMGTAFGREEVVDRDREVLGQMYREVMGYLQQVGKIMHNHRAINVVLQDFENGFPKLFDRRYFAQQRAQHDQHKRLRDQYAQGVPKGGQPIGRFAQTSPAEAQRVITDIFSPPGEGGAASPKPVAEAPLPPSPPPSDTYPMPSSGSHLLPSSGSHRVPGSSATHPVPDSGTDPRPAGAGASAPPAEPAPPPTTDPRPASTPPADGFDPPPSPDPPKPEDPFRPTS